MRARGPTRRVLRVEGRDGNDVRRLPPDQIAPLDARGSRRLYLYILFPPSNVMLIGDRLLYDRVPLRRRSVSSEMRPPNLLLLR